MISACRCITCWSTLPPCGLRPDQPPLTFKLPPDFEEPRGSANHDSNIYKMKVIATGGTGSRARTAERTITVTVTDVVDETAVPALPVAGQLLLALLLMARGARLFPRRRG